MTLQSLNQWIQEEIGNMSKDEANKQKNSEILRAKDIIPPYNKKIHQEQKLSLKDEAPQPTGNQTKHTEMFPPKHEDTARQKAEIPQFDLANQILSEQRKVATIKRKKPGPKNDVTSHNPKVPSTDYTLKPPPMLSLQEKIIAEIVARDIQKLRKSHI